MKRFGDGRDWFFEKRFGLFVHWGLYATLGWHEQHQWRARVSRDEYGLLTAQWNPARFDPDDWLDIMESAGMEYICLTTKHHDGFCLWEHQTDHVQHHEHAVQSRHRGDACPGLPPARRTSVPLLLGRRLAPPELSQRGTPPRIRASAQRHSPDWDRYVEFLREQVRELCTNYGEISGFWWDMNVPEAIDRSINNMIRDLQPRRSSTIAAWTRATSARPSATTTRMRRSAEFRAPDRSQPICRSRQLGLSAVDEDTSTDRHLLRSIANYLARDANYLLNVGPNAQGEIPTESTAILQRIGAWYQNVREAFENVEPAPS
jgi:alpha-L-fucosidase